MMRRRSGPVPDMSLHHQRLEDVDTDPKFVHVRGAKGKKDRYII